MESVAIQLPLAGRFLKKAPQKRHLFVKLFKSLAPGRAAGGVFELNSYERRTTNLEPGIFLPFLIVLFA